MIRQLVGDCRETLRTLEPGTVQAVITSPPYYGLRDYGTPPLVWGQTCCDHPHEWGASESAPWANELPSAKSVTRRNNAFHETMGKTAGSFHRNGREKGTNTGEQRDGRNWRTSDLFFDSWQGLVVDEHDDPLALVVNPMPFKGSHFATFPPKLVEPMVKASTRPGDVVLDPFGGAGTVGLVADRLGRDAVLCELKPGYGDMATERLVGDAPMFVEMTGGGMDTSPEPVEDKQAALGKRTYSGFNARWDAKEASA